MLFLDPLLPKLEELGVEPLLLHIERSQLRWLGHLFRMPPGRLPREVFLACPAGRRPRGRPRTRWSDYVAQLAWERLGILPEELEEVSGEREVWVSQAAALTTRPQISGWKWMDGLPKLWNTFFPRNATVSSCCASLNKCFSFESLLKITGPDPLHSIWRSTLLLMCLFSWQGRSWLVNLEELLLPWSSKCKYMGNNPNFHFKMFKCTVGVTF